jgi:hypothetical protein
LIAASYEAVFLLVKEALPWYNRFTTNQVPKGGQKDMSDLLALTSTVITTASALLEFAKNLKNAELQIQIAEMKIQLANIKNEIASLIRENGELKGELANTEYENKNKLIYNDDDGYYYDGETKNPYCPQCYESEKIRMHLKKGSSTCPRCEIAFRTPTPIIIGTPRPNPPLKWGS